MSKELQQLEKRIKRLDKVHTKSANVKPSPAKLAMNAGIELLCGIAVGATLGYMLDKYLNTKFIFIFVGIVLGLIAGTLNLYRYVKKENL